MQENLEIISDQLQKEYLDERNKGFYNWSLADYTQFIKAIKRSDRLMTDIEGIASEISTKSYEQVKNYHEAFMRRFRETKEKELVLKKLQLQEFDTENQ